MPNQIWRKYPANPSHARTARRNGPATTNIKTVSVVANISNCINRECEAACKCNILPTLMITEMTIESAFSEALHYEHSI